MPTKLSADQIDLMVIDLFRCKPIKRVLIYFNAEMKDALAKVANLIQNMQPIQGHPLYRQASAGNVGLPSSAKSTTADTCMVTVYIFLTLYFNKIC